MVKMKCRWIIKIVFTLVLLFVAIIMISPVVMMIVLSLQDGAYVYIDFFIWEPELLYALFNSIIIASMASIGTVIISIPAALVLAKVVFHGRDIIFYLYVVVMMLPFQVMMLPQYILSNNLNIYDTLCAVILPSLFAPFGTFLLTQSIRVVNNEIFDAARLETSSILIMITQILIPIIRPAIVCVWVLSFCESWNAVSEPLVFLETVENFPIAIQLHFLSKSDALGFAGATIFTLLPLLIFTTLDDEIIEGLGRCKLK